MQINDYKIRQNIAKTYKIITYLSGTCPLTGVAKKKADAIAPAFFLIKRRSIPLKEFLHSLLYLHFMRPA